MHGLLSYYLLLDWAARSKRASEVSSWARIISGYFLTIFPPVIPILHNLQYPQLINHLLFIQEAKKL